MVDFSYLINTSLLPNQNILAVQEEAASSRANARAVGVAGTWMQAAAGAVGAISSFYGVKSQQMQMRQSAATMEFQAGMVQMAASQMEQQAQFQLLAGQRDVGRSTLAYGIAKGTLKAAQGASGVKVSSASFAEQRASIEYAKEMDRYTISANSLRAANASRMQRVNLVGQRQVLRAQAIGMRKQANALSPELALGSSLLGSAGQVAASWAALPA